MNHDAVYPGTFDPLTLGHLDLIERSSGLFDHVTVAVAATSAKSGAMFGLEERMQMVREAVAESGFQNVSVEPLKGLLVDFCMSRPSVPVLIRGIRVYTDFEYEFQMALTNRKLAPEVETLFMMPVEEHSCVTASTVRELVRYGGDTTAFVPPAVLAHIQAYMKEHRIQRNG
jgi:pantetheine-phosphate adenylyltransferase